MSCSVGHACACVETHLLRIKYEFSTLSTDASDSTDSPDTSSATKPAGALATAPVAAYRRRQGQSHRLAAVRALIIPSRVHAPTPARPSFRARAQAPQRQPRCVRAQRAHARGGGPQTAAAAAAESALASKAVGETRGARDAQQAQGLLARQRREGVGLLRSAS